MGTYNGARYLSEQLESIKAQSYQHWNLLVSDDGSSDETLQILQKFRGDCDRQQISIVQGSREGFGANFLSLVLNSDLEGDYFAFSDQDDIWLPQKLEHALDSVSQFPAALPVVYGSRTQYISHEGKHLGFSPLLRRPPSFGNALAQNIAGGNTMVFNRAALELLRTIGKVEIVSHDWWLYLVIMAAGGKFIFDATPHVLYRQHEKNLVGANSSLKGNISRATAMLRGRYCTWIGINLAALGQAEKLMNVETLAVLNMFRQARSAMFLRRLVLLYRSGVRRQSFLGNCGLAVAGLLKRI